MPKPRYTKTITSWDDVPVIFDIEFAAILLRIPVTTLKKWSREGKFPGRKKGERIYRIEKGEFMEWYKNDQIEARE